MEKAIVLSAVVVVWLAFTLWTVKKLWQSSENPQEALFWAEVKLGSLAITIGSSLLLPAIGDFPPLSFWLQVAILAFLLFPASAWSMYFGMRLFHAIFDLD